MSFASFIQHIQTHPNKQQQYCLYMILIFSWFVVQESQIQKSFTKILPQGHLQMLKNNHRRDHQRNNSQLELFYPNYAIQNSTTVTQHQQRKNKTPKLSQNITSNGKVSKSKSSKKNRLQLNCDSRKNQLKGDNILELVKNSGQFVKNKSTVIETIDPNQNNENIDTTNTAYSQLNNTHQNNSHRNRNNFFQFGNTFKVQNQQYANDQVQNILSPNAMQQIPEVPDTMSNERNYDQQINKHYEQGIKKHLEFIEESKNKQSLKEQTNKQRKTKKQHNDQTGDTESFLKFKKGYKNKLKLNKGLADQKQEKVDNFEFDFTEFMEKQGHALVIQKGQNQTLRKKSAKSINKEKHSQSKDLKITKQTHSKQQTSKKSKLHKQKHGLSYKSINSSTSTSNPQTNKSRSLPNNEILVKKNKSFLSLNRDSHSTNVSLSKSRQKISSKNSSIIEKIKKIEHKTNRLENNYKQLWDCMGEVWENERIARYLSEKNKKSIDKLVIKEEQSDEKLILLKAQILKDISSARYKN